MNLHFLHSPVNDLNDETTKPTPGLVHEPLDYTSEGSEFLDDAIRMKDQPLIYTQESAGSQMPVGFVAALHKLFNNE